MFAFGQPESGGEAIAPRDVEGETAEGAGDGGGDRDGDDGDGDGTTSGSSIDLSQVKAVRCHAPNTFGTVNMEHTIDSSLSWSKR